MNYRKEIDGLRAFAVLPVIFFHAGFQLFSGGFVGVDVFFVISGYLIASIILTEMQEGTFTLVGFYERRARRILPALFVVMSACLPFAWLWLLPSDMKDFSESLVAVSVFSSNILFWRESGYFDVAAELKPLLHTWSLAVEEQYYLLFPIFLLQTRRLDKRLIVGILVVVAFLSLAAAQWGSLNKPADTFYLLPTRIWELLIGVLIAFYIFTRKDMKNVSYLTSQLASFIGLVLIAYAVFAFDKSIPFPGLYALVPTIGAALVILFATPYTIVGMLLSSKVLVGIGLISYSAYLWHQPIFVFARHRSLNEPGTVLLLTLSVFVFFFAYISWKYIERPFRSKSKISRKSIFLLSLVCGASFIAFGLIGHFNGGHKNRFDDEIMAVLSARNDLSPQSNECHSDANKYIKPGSTCVIGDEKNLIGSLLGDSQALIIADELGKALHERHLGMRHMSYSGCPPVLNIYRADLKDDNKCSDFNGDVFRYLRDSKEYQYVLLVARWTLYLEKNRFNNGEGGIEAGGIAYIDILDKNTKLTNYDQKRRILVKEKYKQTVLEYLGQNKKVILVYPIPEAGWDVPAYAAKLKMFRGDSADNITTSYRVFSERNKEAYKALDSIGLHPNLVRIRPEELLCRTNINGRCLVQLNGVPLYSDDNHLSNAGARLVVNEIMKYVRK